MLDLILAMTVLEKFFLACALSGTVVFFIRMLLMFSGMIGGDGELDAGGHDACELTDDVHDDISHGIDTDAGADTDLVADDASGEHHNLNNSDVSFHFVSVQGLTAFFMMFGWVGLAIIRDSGLPGWVATIGGALGGFVTVMILAQMFKFAGSLKSDGTVRVRRALGSGGSVYLRIPAEGTGQVQVEVDGRLRMYDAISSKKEEIKTGEQITVVWVQDNGVLVVDKDTREEGGKLCGQ